MKKFFKNLFKTKQVAKVPKTAEELAREDVLRAVFSKLNEILKAHPLNEWAFDEKIIFDGTIRSVEFSLGRYTIRFNGTDDEGFFHTAKLIFFFIKSRETDDYASYVYGDAVCSTVIDREGLALSASTARDGALAERKRKVEELKSVEQKVYVEKQRKILDEFLSSS